MSAPPLDLSLLAIYEQAFSDPERAMSRLYDMAKRDQWDSESLPWDQANFDGVPLPLREALAGLYTQIHYGEVASLIAAARCVEHAPDLGSRLFASTQVMDEARHVEWFTRLIRKLDCRPPVHPAVAALIDDIHRDATPEGLLIGMQLLVEGLAQSLFQEGGRLLRGLDVSDPMFAPLSGVVTVLGDWMVNYVGRDESRHVAFGILQVGRRIRLLPPAQVDVLQRRTEQWGGLVLAIAADQEPRFATLGLDAGAFARRCIGDLNGRLRQAGLEVQLPLPGDG